MSSLLFEDLTRELIRSCFDVFNELRGGLLETSYRNAMMVSLGEKGIPCEREKPVDVWFHLNFGEAPTFKRMIYDRNNPTRPAIDEIW